MAVSGCILVKNEAKLLSQCLRSIAPYMDELIVVDNGSTDGTLSVAKTFGCKLISSPDTNFDEGRNAYLEAASEPWIFVIDADECITPEGGTAIRNAILNASPDTVHIYLPRFEYIGKGKWAYIRIYRLFRSNAGLYYGNSRVHAPILPILSKEKIEYAYAPIHHLDGLYEGRALGKRERNVSRLINDIEQGGEGTGRLQSFLGVEYMALGELGKAEVEFKKSIDSYKGIDNQPRARLYLAQLYLLQNKLLSAKREAESLLPFEVGHREQSATVLAEVAVRQGKTNKALDICMEALRVNPMSPHLHMNIASLLQDSDPSDAIAHLNQAITLNPYLLKPIIYKTGEAPNIFQHQITFLSKTQTIYECMERCWKILGKLNESSAWKEARECVAQIIEQNVENRFFETISPSLSS